MSFFAQTSLSAPAQTQYNDAERHSKVPSWRPSARRVDTEGEVLRGAHIPECQHGRPGDATHRTPLPTGRKKDVRYPPGRFARHYASNSVRAAHKPLCHHGGNLSPLRAVMVLGGPNGVSVSSSQRCFPAQESQGTNAAVHRHCRLPALQPGRSNLVLLIKHNQNELKALTLSITFDKK